MLFKNSSFILTFSNLEVRVSTAKNGYLAYLPSVPCYFGATFNGLTCILFLKIEKRMGDNISNLELHSFSFSLFV